MNTMNDGGPAFPCDWKDFQSGTGEQVVREQFWGMSLRDWFASTATDGDVKTVMDIHHPVTRTQARYIYADAMLAERSE